MNRLTELLAVWSNLTELSRLIIFAIAAAFCWLMIKFDEKAVHSGPALLTTLGIFGTFLGIALSLLHFNPSNIQASLPALLDGMKLAFWASAAGVFAALLLKARYHLLGVKGVGGAHSPEDFTIADLHRELASIHKALVGNEESTLVSQLKLSRQDMNDRLDSLRRSQEESLKKLSEMGSAALVEALRDVIRDFNAKINEQFGENFKQLNEAVTNLVVWQDQYKEHLEESRQALSSITESTNRAQEQYSMLVGKAEAFMSISTEI